MTLTGPAALFVDCLDGARPRGDKLFCRTNGGQPKAVEVGKVVAGTTCTLAFYDGVSPEILEAAPSRSQRLATALITCPCVLKEIKDSKCTFSKLTAFSSHEHDLLITLTERKEYPVHRLLQPSGHAGTS